MKKLLLLPSLVLLLTSVVVNAQQDAQNTQFFLNKMNYNPAYAGSEDKICAMVLYRSQWLGFGDDKKGLSPSTFIGSINGPIGDKIGLGLNILRDQQGFETSLNPMVSAAYRYHFQNEGVLALGLGVGLMQKSQDGTKLKPLQPGDPKIPTTLVTGNAMDLNMGLYYTLPALWRFDNFYASLSATHLNQATVKYGSVDNKLTLHYFFMTGASYLLIPSLSIDPNIFVKTIGAKTSADINVMATYNNRFRGGLSYRSEDAISILLGFKITPDMQVGYSYDLTTSNIIKYSSGSHEILFKYCFMPKLKEKPEKQPIPRLTPRFL